MGYSNPMTYRTREGRQVIVIATGSGANAKLVAFALRAADSADKRGQSRTAP